MYDQGKTEVQIAREKRRDLRTIVKGIEEAVLERNLASAEADLLRNALFRHQEHLTGILKNISDMLVMPPDNLELREERDGLLTPIPLPNALVKQESKDEITVIFSDENKLEWELLKEHLKQDNLWGLLRQWREAMSDSVRARWQLKRWIKTQCDKDSDTRLSKIATLIYDLAIKKILELPDKTDLEEKYGPNAVNLLNKSLRTSEASTVIKSMKILNEITTSAKRTVEEILLLGMITGKCRVCRRLGR
jgi:hypothetical protein